MYPATRGHRQANTMTPTVNRYRLTTILAALLVCAAATTRAEDIVLKSDVAELRRARSRVGGGARRRIRRARLRRDAPGQQGRARRPFHSAHGLDRQGDGGPDAREHGGRRHGDARRPARQIRAVRRQGAGIRGASDYPPRSRDLYGRPATRSAGRAGPAAGAESVHGLPSGRLLALARAGKVAL